MRIHRKLAAGAGALAAAGAFAAASAPADAAAPTQCVKRDSVASHFFCPLNRGNVPVYATPDGERPVGTLRSGGLANFFMFQVKGPRVTRGRFSNNWWAYTQADRVNGKPGAMGYVPRCTSAAAGSRPPRPRTASRSTARAAAAARACGPARARLSSAVLAVESSQQRGDHHMRIQRKLAAGVGALATVVACAVGTASAEAAGPTVCRATDPDATAHFYCPLNSSRVPVYKSPALGKRVGLPEPRRSRELVHAPERGPADHAERLYEPVVGVHGGRPGGRQAEARGVGCPRSISAAAAPARR